MNQPKDLLCGDGILHVGGGRVRGTMKGAERVTLTLRLKVGWFVRSILEQLIHCHLHVCVGGGARA